MTNNEHTTMTRLFMLAIPTPHFVAVLTSLLALFVSSPYAMARCEDGQKEVATLYMQEARGNTDDIGKLVLLKQSAKACPDFVIWLELGRVQLALENSTGAVSAFENARDYYLPDASGRFTSSEVKRQAIGNAWLAEAYRYDGKLASASVATQEARIAYQALNQQPPQRLVRIQAEIDDAMVGADASVLARSFEIQHQRATRGIGVRPTVQNNQELTEESAETASLEADYSGISVSSIDLESETVSEVASDTSGNAIAIVKPLSNAQTQRPTSESRLNIPVLFEYNSADLSSVSRKTVEQLSAAIDILKLDRTASVKVVGHTDSRGSSSYNQRLSVQRANTVLAAIQLLIQAKPIIEAVGRGEEELRYAGDAKDDHRRNRRVEIIVRR